MLLRHFHPSRALDWVTDVADDLTSDADLEELSALLGRPKFDCYASIEDRRDFPALGPFEDLAIRAPADFFGHNGSGDAG